MRTMLIAAALLATSTAAHAQMGGMYGGGPVPPTTSRGPFLRVPGDNAGMYSPWAVRLPYDPAHDPIPILMPPGQVYHPLWRPPVPRGTFMPRGMERGSPRPY